ncbi:hypothetical protein [Denitromonas iodatirespirans]|uniref:Uncharacterized protein n=1 Tax=Denitromonas iodatirespirans TaxID=2795389 RepID=A0A944D971_DENI1|nr:hypothetical protein [Denitromonas iodatirespirans]MBT0962279.1 hypothetical protein [Denitromonas iodatirespirans]
MVDRFDGASEDMVAQMGADFTFFADSWHFRARSLGAWSAAAVVTPAANMHLQICASWQKIDPPVFDGVGDLDVFGFSSEQSSSVTLTRMVPVRLPFPFSSLRRAQAARNEKTPQASACGAALSTSETISWPWSLCVLV